VHETVRASSAGELSALVDAGILREGAIAPGPPATCPDCGAPGLAPVVEGGCITFVCPSCGAAWEIALGHVRRLRPAGPAVLAS